MDVEERFDPRGRLRLATVVGEPARDLTEKFAREFEIAAGECEGERAFEKGDRADVVAVRRSGRGRARAQSQAVVVVARERERALEVRCRGVVRVDRRRLGARRLARDDRPRAVVRPPPVIRDLSESFVRVRKRFQEARHPRVDRPRLELQKLRRDRFLRERVSEHEPGVAPRGFVDEIARARFAQGVRDRLAVAFEDRGEHVRIESAAEKRGVPEDVLRRRAEPVEAREHGAAYR